MSESLKTISVVVACIAIAGIGYYVVTQSGDPTNLNENSALREELINKTQAFIEHRNQLEQIDFDQSFFTDSTFTSLQSFSTPVPNQTIGRDNIFGQTAAITATAQRETQE